MKIGDYLRKATDRIFTQYKSVKDKVDKVLIYD